MSPEILNAVSQRLNIYLGLVMFTLGVIGCLWNLLILRHHSLRSSSCCTYMFIGSWASLIQLVFGLLCRILVEGFNFDQTVTNIAWCKIRNYITLSASLIALSCLVWSAMDRFFSTCREIKWRYLNSAYVARQICLSTIIFWMLVAIPTLIYTVPMQSKSAKRVCDSSSVIWSKIATYFLNLFCYGIFPWLFMSLFGCLTLRNVRRIRHQRIHPLPNAVLVRMTRVDKQLTSILFWQILICFCSSVPYCIENIYESVTQSISKSPQRQAEDHLFLQIVRLAFYFNYISMFYVNYISSSIFRQLSKKVLLNLVKKKDDVSREITIINHGRIELRRSRIATIQPSLSDTIL